MQLLLTVAFIPLSDFLLRDQIATAMAKPSIFDPLAGFTVTNNSGQDVYLQTDTDTFVKIKDGDTSGAFTVSRDYDLRTDNKTDAKIYLTVKVSSWEDGGGVNIVPGTEVGAFAVTSNFI